MRQEDHANGVVPVRRQGDLRFRRCGRHEFPRQTQEQAGAVAGPRVASAGAAMPQVHEDLEPLFDYPVGGLTLKAGHHPNAARVVLVFRANTGLARRSP